MGTRSAILAGRMRAPGEPQWLGQHAGRHQRHAGRRDRKGASRNLPARPVKPGRPVNRINVENYSQLLIYITLILYSVIFLILVWRFVLPLS